MEAKEVISMDSRKRWSIKRDELVEAVTALGFPPELGDTIARHLGSPKAMDRMIAYLNNVQPRQLEIVVDEMLALRSEVDAWREKKANEEANRAYNYLLYYGLPGEDDLG